MVDSIYRTRSLGVAAEGIPDQYADGKAARVWEAYIGCIQSRTSQYRQWVVELLNTKACTEILDAACGIGVDSIMLLEEGFHVTSTDASDKMLKYAMKERWTRRKLPAFDNWVIEEGNWISLVDDVRRFNGDAKFDAVLCLGNSFAHLPDFDGDLRNQRRALQNFKGLLKPGGILVIDHRNYDEILASGQIPAKNVYYNSSHVLGIKCSTLHVDGKPVMVTMDYNMDVASLSQEYGKTLMPEREHNFRLSYYPYRLQQFSELLQDVFGQAAEHEVYGDFKHLGGIDKPAYYIHVVQCCS